MTTYRTVIIAGEGARYEYNADAIVVPGDVVAQTATGCTPFATAGAKAPPMFAIEDEIFGRGINPGSGYQAINSGVNYAIGDRVLCEMCTPGMQVAANVAAGAAAIHKGDFLTTGAVPGKLYGGGTAANAVGIAQEDVDNSAGATDTRIRIMIV